LNNPDKEERLDNEIAGALNSVSWSGSEDVLWTGVKSKVLRRKPAFVWTMASLASLGVIVAMTTSLWLPKPALKPEQQANPPASSNPVVTNLPNWDLSKPAPVIPRNTIKVGKETYLPGETVALHAEFSIYDYGPEALKNPGEPWTPDVRMVEVRSVERPDVPAVKLPLPDLSGVRLSYGDSYDVPLTFAAPAPGWYSVGFIWPNGGADGKTESYGEMTRFFVTYPAGMMKEDSLFPARSVTVEGYTMTLSNVVMTPEKAIIRFGLADMPMVPLDFDVEMLADGQPLKSLDTAYGFSGNGGRITSERTFSPVPAGTKTLTFRVLNLKTSHPGDGIDTPLGPWEVTIDLQ
jgi:hypothetical protein